MGSLPSPCLDFNQIGQIWEQSNSMLQTVISIATEKSRTRSSIESHTR